MKIKILTIAFFLILLSNFGFAAIVAHAQNSGGTPNLSTGAQTVGGTNNAPNVGDSIYNPFGKIDNLTDAILAIMKGFLAIIAIWAVLFVVIGGFRMVMSQGDEEAYTKAKKTITWAVLGLVVAVLSFAIIAMVQNFLGVTVQK